MADSEVRQKYDDPATYGLAFVQARTSYELLTGKEWRDDGESCVPEIVRAAYQEGMRAGEIARWIPVEEKLPPTNTKVLVWFRENTTTGPIYIPRFGEISCGHWRPEGGNGNFDDRVTHWQPLPAAPEEKNA